MNRRLGNFAALLVAALVGALTAAVALLFMLLVVWYQFPGLTPQRGWPILAVLSLIVFSGVGLVAYREMRGKFTR